MPILSCVILRYVSWQEMKNPCANCLSARNSSVEISNVLSCIFGGPGDLAILFAAPLRERDQAQEPSVYKTPSPRFASQRGDKGNTGQHDDDHACQRAGIVVVVALGQAGLQRPVDGGEQVAQLIRKAGLVISRLLR